MSFDPETGLNMFDIGIMGKDSLMDTLRTNRGRTLITSFKKRALNYNKSIFVLFHNDWQCEKLKHFICHHQFFHYLTMQ